MKVEARSNTLLKENTKKPFFAGDFYFPVYVQYLEENAKVNGEIVTIEVNEKELFDKIAHYGNEKMDQKELQKAIDKINKQPTITKITYNKTTKIRTVEKTGNEKTQWTDYLISTTYGCFQEFPDYPKLNF